MAALRSGHDPTAPRFPGDARPGPCLDLGLPVHPPLPTCEWLPWDDQIMCLAHVGRIDRGIRGHLRCRDHCGLLRKSFDIDR